MNDESSYDGSESSPAKSNSISPFKSPVKRDPNEENIPSVCQAVEIGEL